MRATLLIVVLATLFSLSFAKANQDHGVKTFPVEEMSSLGDKLLALARMLKRPPGSEFLRAYDLEVLCGPNKYAETGIMVALIFHDILNGYSAKYFHSISLATQYAQRYGFCEADGRAGSRTGSLTLKYVATNGAKKLSLLQKNLFLILSQANANAVVDMDNSAFNMKGLASAVSCNCYEPDVFFSDYLGSVAGEGRNRAEAKREARNKCPVPGWLTGDPFTDPERPVVVCEHSYLAGRNVFPY